MAHNQKLGKTFVKEYAV